MRRKDEYVPLSSLCIYYTYIKKYKNPCKNNKFKVSLNELPDESYSVSDIQDYFEYTLKNHGTKTINPSIKIYVNICLKLKQIAKKY